jgi:glycosyltransferase 2 family protein
LLENILKRPHVKTGLILLFTIIIFFILFENIDIFSVFQILVDSNKVLLCCAFLITLTVEIIVAKRWQIILKTMNCDISLKEAFYIILGTFPFALITPSFSSDFIRAIPLQNKIRRSKVIGTCFTERFFDFLILFLLFILGMILTGNYHFFTLALIFLLVLTLTLILISLNIQLPIGEKWQERINNILLSIRILNSEKHVMIPILFYSFLLWSISIIQTMILFEAVGLSIPLVDTMANLPIAIFIGQIPITFGGAGTRDAAIIFLFSSFASPQKLLAVGLLFTLLRCWILAIIGIPFLKFIGLHNIYISLKEDQIDE